MPGEIGQHPGENRRRQVPVVQPQVEPSVRHDGISVLECVADGRLDETERLVELDGRLYIRCADADFEEPAEHVMQCTRAPPRVTRDAP